MSPLHHPKINPLFVLFMVQWRNKMGENDTLTVSMDVERTRDSWVRRDGPSSPWPGGLFSDLRIKETEFTCRDELAEYCEWLTSAK